MNSETADTFKVWAEDNAAYGPVDLGTVVSWIQDQRVFPNSFVQPQSDKRWRQARDVEAFREHFGWPQTGEAEQMKTDTSAVAGDLRELAVFSGISGAGLEQLAALGEFYQAAPGAMVVQNGHACDAVYFILCGELRVRLLVGIVDKADKTLCKIGGGESFGELGMFLQAKRTADVIAETESRLFRMTTSAFMLLVRQIPELGSPVLFNIGVTMARRMAEDNQRFYREVTSQFLWG